MIRDTFQRTVILACVVVAAIASLLPTVFRENFPKSWPTKPIALGLDISGGVHLVYGVKSQEAVKSRLQSMTSNIRSKLREDKIAVASSAVGADNSVQIALLSDASAERAKAVVAEVAPELPRFFDKPASGAKDRARRDRASG
jgi:preprotein translocase subunit SecD